MNSSIYALVVLVPLLPWLAAVWIAALRVVGRARRPAGERPTIIASLGASAMVLVVLLVLDVIAVLKGAPGQVRLGEWFSSGELTIELSFTLDGLSLALSTLAAFISLLTMRFSVNYLHRETGFQRYFMIMNLFVGAMALILLAGNAVLTFVGWELAGVSSFLLIGYVLDRPVATGNANRAFVTNRIGDAGFILGIYFAYTWTGSVEWDRINGLGGGPGTLGLGLMATGFLIAALAKSAQAPFSPWIARALEGPTPSSAIFYGALLVHAGVYLIIRLEPLLSHQPGVMAVIAGIGLLTALYGWLSGLVQSDVKGSLMFATTAQVGLMFLWCGLGWFELAAWHLGLHASWRAYQFLHAPMLLFMIDKAARPVPEWLAGNRWLYTAAMQRFWMENIGDALITRPTAKLAADAQAFEEQVVNPLAGLPSQASAVSSLEKWDKRQQSGIVGLPEGRVGRGQGLAGKLLEGIAGMLHWIEDQLVLKGSGEGLMRTLQRLGGYLMQIDVLLSQPRYLLLMIAITFVIIL